LIGRLASFECINPQFADLCDHINSLAALHLGHCIKDFSSTSSSKISDKYDKMALEAMGGSGGPDKEKEEKIIHNISKCVVIDKYVDEN